MPCKSASFEDDSELESYNNAEKNLFYLINKKNNCSIAFVEGVLEFVSIPGNPFKFKVFQDFPLANDPLLLDEGNSVSPFIDIKIDKISVTIYHELSDTIERVPLLQMSMVVPEFIIQKSHAKTRVITKLVTELYSFDAKRNLWYVFILFLQIHLRTFFLFII